MNEKILSQAKELASRPYSIRIAQDSTTEGEPIFFATNPELPGCQAQGKTMDEVLTELYNARVDYIASLLEDGLPVSAPRTQAVITSGAMATSTWAFAVAPMLQGDLVEYLGRVAQRQNRDTLVEIALTT